MNSIFKNIVVVIFLMISQCANIIGNDSISNPINFIVSSSPKGEYVIGTNIVSKESVLIEVKENKIKAYLPKDVAKYFAVWNSDTTFIYATDRNAKTLYYQYFLGKGMSKEIGEAKGEVLKTVQQSNFIKSPNFIEKNGKPFILFVLEKKIGICYPLDNEIKYVYNLEKKIKSGHITSIAVDTKCERIILVVSKTDGIGKIIQLNIKDNGSEKIIEESKYIINDSYVYFLNNDSSIVYFRYKAVKSIEVILRNIFSNKEKVLYTFSSVAPSYVVDIPFYQSIIISGLDMQSEIKVEKGKNDILEDIFKELITRFKVIAVSYK